MDVQARRPDPSRIERETEGDNGPPSSGEFLLHGGGAHVDRAGGAQGNSRILRMRMSRGCVESDLSRDVSKGTLGSHLRRNSRRKRRMGLHLPADPNRRFQSIGACSGFKLPLVGAFSRFSKQESVHLPFGRSGVGDDR